MVRKQKVLIVDDDKALREMFVSMLINAGYEATGAGDGDEAFALIKKEKFAVVLLDVMLPKMDGLEVLKKLKNEKLIGNAGSVVMMSNLAKQAVQDQATKLGVARFFEKSAVDKGSLVGIVESLSK